MFWSDHALNLNADITQFRTSVIDATWMSDGTLVYLKRTPSDSQELQIASYLSSQALRLDPRNHCVPLLDILQDPLNPDTAFMVIPFLRYKTSPPFEVVGDIGMHRSDS